MNSVVWFEIPFDQKERAQKFYQDVFGWNISQIPEMGDYLLANTTESDPQTMQPKNPGAINGGMFQKKSETTQHPVVAVHVESIDDYLKKIESSNGKTIMPKTDIGQFGFYALISDTEGNTIGIWESPKQQ